MVVMVAAENHRFIQMLMVLVDEDGENPGKRIQKSPKWSCQDFLVT